MPHDNLHGLVKKQGLTGTELTDIQALAERCVAAEGVDLRLPWDLLRARPAHETNDFLYYQEGTLIGFLALDCMSFAAAEATGMVHPAHRRRGVFRALVGAAVDESRRRGYTKLLLICDHTSRSGRSFVETIGSWYQLSEYRMDLEVFSPPRSFDEQLSLRRAMPPDAGLVTRLLAMCFGVAEEEIAPVIAREILRQSRMFFIANLGPEPIGTINLQIGDYEIGVYGFGVRSEYRGRGYGRQILARAIEIARAEYDKPIFIEVETENRVALALYESCGFKQSRRFDYYRLDIGE